MLFLVLGSGLPASARAEQPMDRLAKLIEGGRAADAEEAARKWLERNSADRRAGAVIALLVEASWQVVAEDPSLDGVRAWRAEFGAQEAHAQEAFELEATLSWYAALRAPSESTFRAIVDDFGGTRAADEANVAAGNQGLVEARAAGTTEALSGWLNRYPGHEEREEVRALLDERVWADAEAADTAQSWLDLRAAFPDHPRAREAREREGLAALRELGADAGPEDLAGLGVRYAPTEAGRLAWRRVVRGGVLVETWVGRQSWGRADALLFPRVQQRRTPLKGWPSAALEAAASPLFGVEVELPVALPCRAALALRMGEHLVPGEPLVGDAVGGAAFVLPEAAAVAFLGAVTVALVTVPWWLQRLALARQDHEAPGLG